MRRPSPDNKFRSPSYFDRKRACWIRRAPLNPRTTSASNENCARRIPAEELTAAISEALTAAEIARFDRRLITTEVARNDPVEARELVFDARIAPDFLVATAELDDDAFSRALDALVESARRAVRERLRASGPSGIATVVLGPDHRMSQVVIDADAPLHIDGVEGARG